MANNIPDQEAFYTYVGHIGLDGFMAPFRDCDDPVQEAINNLFDNWPWEGDPPEWLEEALERYCRD